MNVEFVPELLLLLWAKFWLWLILLFLIVVF